MSGIPRPSLFSLIYNLFFFLLFLPVAVTSAGFFVGNTSVPQCYSVTCGDGVEIRYPFWLSRETNTSYCGYPNLGIVCQDGHPVLKLGGGSYQVVGVQYVSNTVTLQDIDLLGSDCPRPRHNLTLEGGIPLAYAETNAFLFFFFNCSGNFPDDHKLPCLSGGGGNSSYVFPGGAIPRGYDWRGRCQDRLVAAALKAEIASSGSSLPSAFGAMLSRGFQLAWQAPDMADCASCEETGGKCGYGNSDDAQGYKFRCFCKHGAHAPDCSGNTSGIDAPAHTGEVKIQEEE